MTKNTSRSDRVVDERGCLLAAWAIRLEPGEALFREYLITVQELKYCSDDVFHGHMATHELHVFALSPEVEVDFDTNLFEQSSLRPLTPSRVAYQFRSVGPLSALEIAAQIVDDVDKGHLDPHDPEDEGWSRFFIEGASLRSQARPVLA